MDDAEQGDQANGGDDTCEQRRSIRAAKPSATDLLHIAGALQVDVWQLRRKTDGLVERCGVHAAAPFCAGIIAVFLLMGVDVSSAAASASGYICGSSLRPVLSILIVATVANVLLPVLVLLLLLLLSRRVSEVDNA